MAEEVKDFTNNDKPADVDFKVDGDTFTAVGTPPGMALLDVSAVNKAENMDKLRIIVEFLDQVLTPASAVRFAERLRSAAEPISIDQAASVAVWLMEEVYAPDRPTEAPSASSNGSGSTGQSSTAGAPAPASTPLV